MKVLISADIEGVAGVFHPEQTRAGNGEYEQARRWMTLEANAAIEGAFAGGADEVWVNDSHGGFRNLLPDLIDARACMVLGKPRTLGMMAGLEDSPELVFMVGYHARAQSRGILAHTINSFAFARVVLNGEEVGEAGLYGALAAERGARVALLTGDDVFAEETRPAFPEARFVTVKTAHGYSSGVTRAPARACEMIRRAAQEAVESAAAAVRPRAAQARPARCELRVQTTALADLFCQMPALERIDGVTLSFSAPSVEHAVRTLNCLSAMSFMLR
ncbi:D-aminopeptidase dipeptide-binding protein DppA [Caballeronia glathei]|jgi:D-amino peptidase|uniref:D-aminopeptidase n=1 Tax=Caballeronia glathei TaxID=60547 RepID=A0A069PUM0_9BURK|nr:M55 family metallopeptidase [Caballeronia glathei]KDR43539.1 D-aminopeptidase [Caballeronia glathei]CDY75252.1 D-aminopeptidase dipeptide-binding protein DppA [Caballeronia glathei]